jgi:hypothetical protein
MSTHTPSGVLAAGRTTTTGASIATGAAGAPGAALPDGSGAVAAAGLGGPADGVVRADGEGCAERPGCDGCGRCGVPVSCAEVGAAGGGEGGADLVATGTASMVYVASALPTSRAEPFTTCEPDASAGGVIVTLAKHDPPPLRPGWARAMARPSHQNVTGSLQAGPNHPQEVGYDKVAVTDASAVPWLADSRILTSDAASAGAAVNRTAATPIRAARAGRTARTRTY